MEEAETKGLAAAQLALDTGWDNPEAVMRAGMAMSYLGRRHQDGLAYIERGLTLNRNLAVGWRESGLVHFFMDHPEAAISASKPPGISVPSIRVLSRAM